MTTTAPAQTTAIVKRADEATFMAAVKSRSIVNLKTAKDLIMSDRVFAMINTVVEDPAFTKKAMQVALGLLTQSPNAAKLLKCSPTSFISVLMRATELGFTLDPLMGHCYPVPFKTTCQLLPGYKGLIYLAVKSGYVNYIQARVVYEDDMFDFTEGSEGKIIHKPNLEADRSDDKIRASYAIAKLATGEDIFWVSPRSDILKSQARSAAKDYGPWVTDFGQMARRVPINRLCNDMPKDPNLRNGIAEAVSLNNMAEAGVMQPLHESVIELDPGQYEEVDPMEETLDKFVADKNGEQPTEPDAEPDAEPTEPTEPAVDVSEYILHNKPIAPVKTALVADKREYITLLKAWMVQEGTLTEDQWVERCRSRSIAPDITKFDVPTCDDMIFLMN